MKRSDCQHVNDSVSISVSVSLDNPFLNMKFDYYSYFLHAISDTLMYYCFYVFNSGSLHMLTMFIYAVVIESLYYLSGLFEPTSRQ